MLALDPRVVDMAWEVIETLLPNRPVVEHPLGTHRQRIPDKDCFVGLLQRLVTGCSWDVTRRVESARRLFELDAPSGSKLVCSRKWWLLHSIGCLLEAPVVRLLHSGEREQSARQRSVSFLAVTNPCAWGHGEPRRCPIAWRAAGHPSTNHQDLMQGRPIQKR